ncbi:MAG: hypothetical protein WA823_06845 [Candidatus Acidiferrales bacterium]
MKLHYSVFGLQVTSNLPIPELNAMSSPSPITDLDIHWKTSPNLTRTSAELASELTYVSSYTDHTGAPELKIWSIPSQNLLRLEYSDGAQFWVDRGGTEIWSVWPESLSIDDTATYFLGPVLGLVLRLRGIPCLHASAISFGGRAVAFVGAEGAGKSTTAAALARKGLIVISDDIVALEEQTDRILVKPAYPYLCLWPESVTALYGSPDALPRFAANYEKRCLSLARQSLEFAADPLPLSCIYILGARRSDGPPAIEPVPALEALLTLVANTYATNMLDTAMRAREFESLGRLMRRVPVRRVRAHSDPARIDDLCATILADVKTIP